jgi:hypothetical protein
MVYNGSAAYNFGSISVPIIAYNVDPTKQPTKLIFIVAGPGQVGHPARSCGTRLTRQSGRG